VRPLRTSFEIGARAQATAIRRQSRLCDARQARIGFACGLRGALNLVTMSPLLAALGPHAHSRAGWVTSNLRLERAVTAVVGARFASQMYASCRTRAWRRAAAAQAHR
jgi:hypothetical protein